ESSRTPKMTPTGSFLLRTEAHPPLRRLPVTTGCPWARFPPPPESPSQADRSLAVRPSRYTLLAMQILAIVNPVAGAFRQHPAMRAMLDRLRAMGMQVSVRKTARAGDGKSLARQAAETAGYVIAGGGDGTVREVVEGLAGSVTPLMIWPTGTENLVAK